MSSRLSFNPNQLSVQDLVDYLHTAVSEDDPLYVSIWLSHLEERQVGSPALRNHSWKGTSSLVAATARSYSQTRSLILGCLLSHLSHSRYRISGEIRHVIAQAHQWGQVVLTRWQIDCVGAAAKGKAFLDLPAPKAEKWVLKVLPPPPNSTPFTGCKPLPRPPPTPPASFSSRLPPHAQPPASTPSLPIFHPTPVLSSNSSDPPCRLFLGSLAPQTTDQEIEALLSSTRVPILFLRIFRHSQGKLNVLFSVPSKKDMDTCAKVLDNVSLYGKILFVERAMPEKRDQHFHLLAPNIPMTYRASDLWRLLRPSKCGAANSEVGYDDRGNWIGVSRVETKQAASEGVDYLRRKGFYRASYASGPPPALHPVPPSLSNLQADVKPGVPAPPLAHSTSSNSTQPHSATITTDSYNSRRRFHTSPLSPSIETPQDSSSSNPPPPRPLPSTLLHPLPASRVESTPRSPTIAYSTDFEFFARPSNPPRARVPSPFSHPYEAAFLPIDFSPIQQGLNEAQQGRRIEEQRRKRRRLE